MSAPSRRSPSSLSQSAVNPPAPDEAEEHEQVPGRDRPECPLQRPVDEPERPAGEIPARLDLRLEAVRITPRRPPVLELVPDEPELVADLEVVARRRFAVPARPWAMKDVSTCLAPGHVARRPAPR